MPNPKPLPEHLGLRVPMIARYGSGVARVGYPFAELRPLDWFIVPEQVRSREMVRQAACRRGKRHHERYQTKVVSGGVLVLRLE
jgi:hypothetical protein